ncbi:MAG: 6-phosphogluconolactonase, partial [Candidatus Saccharimonadales bacterium]
MQFILSNDTLEGSQALLSRLLAELESGKRVLWIVSGGSNITASVTVMKQIPSRVQAGLTILLSDERYGPSGHPDSNFQQLLDSGLAVAGARLIPTLQDGLDLAATAAAYATTLQAEFSKAEVIISQLGIGA